MPSTIERTGDWAELTDSIDSRQMTHALNTEQPVKIDIPPRQKENVSDMLARRKQLTPNNTMNFTTITTEHQDTYGTIPTLNTTFKNILNGSSSSGNGTRRSHRDSQCSNQPLLNAFSNESVETIQPVKKGGAGSISSEKTKYKPPPTPPSPQTHHQSQPQPQPQSQPQLHHVNNTQNANKPGIHMPKASNNYRWQYQHPDNSSPLQNQSQNMSYSNLSPQSSTSNLIACRRYVRGINDDFGEQQSCFTIKQRRLSTIIKTCEQQMFKKPKRKSDGSVHRLRKSFKKRLSEILSCRSTAVEKFGPKSDIKPRYDNINQFFESKSPTEKSPKSSGSATKYNMTSINRTSSSPTKTNVSPKIPINNSNGVC